MRLLHCIPNMLNGGAQRQLAYLAEEQVRRGWQVHVALLYMGPSFDRLAASGASIHQLSACTNHDPRLIWQLVCIIRQTKPDVVQTWLNQMDVLGGIAALLLGVPWVLSERSCSQAYPSSLKNHLRAAVGARARAIVSNSSGGDAYWEPHAASTVRRYVIPNAVPLQEVTGVSPVSSDAIGLEPDQKMVLYVGRLSPEKNMENLIPAIRWAARKVALAAYLCGDGTHQAWTEKLIREQGLSKQIRLTGYLPNVWAWMKRSDVFVAVSNFEGCPNAVLEAMACGCPLVLSDIPAHREIVNDESAVFVNPRSHWDIADGIIRSLLEPVEAKRRAQKAQSIVAQLSVAEVARRYEEVYQRAMVGR